MERAPNSQAGIILVDGVLELGPLVLADAEELYALVAANREHLQRWMRWLGAQTMGCIEMRFALPAPIGTGGTAEILTEPLHLCYTCLMNFTL